MFYTGIDWADDHFDFCIVDESGKRIKQFRVQKNIQGFTKAVDHLRNLSAQVEQIPVAIETPNSLLVDYLMELKYTVYSINPKSVDRYRDRYRTSKAKDDYFDAYVLANVLRTDRHNYRPVSFGSDLVRELKILTQDREALVNTRTRLSNQLRACLKTYYPVACELFSALLIPVALEFLKTFPTLDAARRCPRQKMIEFLKAHHIYDQRSAKMICDKLQQEPIPIDPVVIRAKSRQMMTLVGLLIPLCQQIEDYDKQIAELLDKHPGKDIFLSLPGAGNNLAARLLSQMGDNRSRYQHVNQVQVYAGTAPVTRQSGDYKHVKFRWSCNKHFRNTLQLFSFCSLSESAWAYRYYQRHRKMGKTHNHALRCLGNQWLKIIFSMWKSNQPYREETYLVGMAKYVLAQPV